jgi:signal transduction histidine kinase/DNA-binding response OmpR family regulator/ligand-binding sensor domain-containing protein
MPARAAATLPYAVRAWTIVDGLPTSTVQDIAQTPDGYLWLSTTGGLARFDGVRFETFGLAQGLPSNRFQGLAVGRDGTLWISSEDANLIRWDGRTFTSQPTGLLWAASALLALPDGGLIGAAHTDYWLRAERFTRLPPLGQDSVSAAVLDARGGVWMTLGAGTPARFRAGRVLPMEPVGPRLSEADVERLPRSDPRVLQRSNHWILDHRSGVARFVRYQGADVELLDTRLQPVARFEGAADESFQWIDRQGQAWSLAGDGVAARDADTGRLIGTLSLGLTTTRGKLFLDRQDDVWVGSWSQGLFRLARSPLRVFRPPDAAGPMSFNGSLEDRNGRVICWGFNRVWRVERDGLVLVPHGEDQHLRFGTARTTFRNATPSWIEVRDSLGRGGIVHAQAAYEPNMVPDPHYPLSIAIIYNEGVTYASAAPGAEVVRPLLRHTPLVRHLIFDHAGRMWIATTGGLWRLAPGDTQFFTRREGLPADHLRQIHEDRNGTIWIGTYGGGLARFKDGKFATLDRRKGLVEDVVSTVLEDDDANLWLAGNMGIQRVSLAQANDVLDGKSPRVAAVLYARDAGLRNPETTGFPGFRSSDGRLWFGTFDGIAVVDPRLVRGERSTAPAPVIEELSAEGRLISRGSNGFRLAPGQRRFDVRYTGIDLRAPEQLRFRYRLDGVDRDWIDAGEARVATYTNVPPGQHRFRVEAINGAGVLSTSPAEVMLDLEPWLWERWPIQALALVALGAFAFQLWRWRSARLRASAVALQHAVDERTSELVEANSRTETALTTVEAQARRLEALDRARSRFFASVSHEFRTPLTLIQGPLGDVTRGEHGELQAGVREQVSIALDSATRLQRLVDQLLDAARAEAGELRLERVPGDLGAFLVELAQAFAPLAERKRIDFERRFSPGRLIASFDRMALEKVFANLLGNAFKFTPEGGHVTWSAAHVDDGTPAGVVEVAVADDGPGIAAEDVPHIFKHFYRSERSVTRVQPGTGLGLALAHDMVEQHGGTLTVESREGHGATFTVRLPLIDAVAPEGDGMVIDPKLAASLADEIRLAPGETFATAALPDSSDAPLVLVVDDHSDVRAYVARQVRRHYRVVEAADGEQALTHMRETVPDLVVSDLAMPVMDGLAFCRAVRSDPELEFVPIILLSAAAETQSRVSGLEGGADDYVTKPFEVSELLARISRMLQSRRRLREHLARAAAEAAVFGPAAVAETPAVVGPATAVTGAPSSSAAATVVDTAFMRRIREVIESRMGEEDFGVEQLAESMGMGRTLLFQRTRELADRTPMELLMSRRLERAAELLAADQGNVGEVAYAVGFRSVAHFTNRFRERFHVTPSAWRRGERPAAASSAATT